MSDHVLKSRRVRTSLRALLAAPMTVDGCKAGGWQVRGFPNQGECVKAFAA